MIRVLRFSTFALGLVLAACLQAEGRKNVLFIAVDDLKPSFGCYGDERAITPNIDALASQGTLFSRAYCQQAVCGPSRASIMTGLRPDRTQVWDLKTRMRDRNPDVLTLPQHFRDLGYTTAGYGKIFDTRCVDKKLDEPSWSQPFKLGYQLPYPEGVEGPLMAAFQDPETRRLIEEANAKGVTAYGEVKEYLLEREAWPVVESADVPDEAYVDSAIVEAGKRSLRAFKRTGEPFFLAVGLKKPHLPFIAPTKYWEMYDREDFEIHPYQKRSQNGVKEAYHSSGELTSYNGVPKFDSYSDDASDWMPEEKQLELIHGYYACVSYIDALIGGLLEELDSLGLREDTVIVLWGDHGWHLGDHGLWCKHSNFEQATRVPLIFSAPGLPKGQVAGGPVEFVDVFPTLCDLAGVTIPAAPEGLSLVSMMEDPKGQVKDFAVSQWPNGKNGMGYAVRDERYRYVEWFRAGNTNDRYNKKSVVSRELYDYEKDPMETVNVVDDPEYAAVVRQMKQRMRSLFAN
ncbi:sulfatase [Pelagicoccus mobilis]|uniref:Sulfatase n=1 Tax=Pelagicoccus mobilis TaxID=415221 RepID=A0A934VQP1_9BACT|nr:sulfatase [Pelagicoccus mobilis]MBK1876694.1 sulfatase [Pelagicoccus mobilis]